MRIDDMTYDTFVKELLYSLRPLVPGKQTVTDFSGGEDHVRDSAILYGDRAVFFSRLGREAAKSLGVDETNYVCDKTLFTEQPILKHSAYAKSIYRWMKGDKPRKRAARADLIILSTCWLYGWGDVDALGVPARDEACKRLHEHLMVDVFFDTKPKEVITALSKISATSYNNTLRDRRTL